MRGQRKPIRCVRSRSAISITHGSMSCLRAPNRSVHYEAMGVSRDTGLPDNKLKERGHSHVSQPSLDVLCISTPGVILPSALTHRQHHETCAGWHMHLITCKVATLFEWECVLDLYPQVM